MKKAGKHHGSKVWKGALIAVCAVCFFFGIKTTSHAESTGKVIAPSARIRSDADMNGTPVAGATEGETVTILNEVTDASGTLWYEVSADGKSGYIRADLIEKDASSDGGGDAADGGAVIATAVNTSAPGANVPAETPMDAQYGITKSPSTRVRSGASTSDSVVDKLPANSQVIVSGQTNGSDGKVWYFVNFTTENGEEKTGYIRSDLMDLGEMVPMPEPEETPPEEQPVDAPVEQPVVNNDYELVYEANDENGEMEWYLYDWTTLSETGQGGRQKLAEVLAAAHAQSWNDAIDAKTVAKQRIVIIVLIALVIILAIVVTVMIFKLRDAYYEAYEDDDEDEEEEEEVRKRPEPVKRKAPPREERPTEARRKPVRTDRPDRSDRPERSGSDRTGRPNRPNRSMPAGEVRYEEDESVPVKTAPKRKAKNFMLEDDEFEFEFLNVKDKDRDR